MSLDDYKENLPTADKCREQALMNFTPFIYDDGTRTMPFRLEFPHQVKPGKTYPLILLFHGAGSLGTDNYLSLFVGELYAMHRLSLRGKAFILVPQCPMTPHWIDHGESWLGLDYTYKQQPTSSMQTAMDILDYVCDNFPVDRNRLAVGGNSMGGYATWDILSRRPGLFKAAFPVCGGADPNRVEDVRNTKLWFFHGAEDGCVSPICSQRMAQALTKANIEFNYTEFPNTNHDSWTPTFTMDDFHRWLNDCLKP